jgi:hypothetical protein
MAKANGNGNGNGFKVIELDPKAVIETLIRDERNYLSNPEAAPNTIHLEQYGETFSPLFLLRYMGQTVFLHLPTDEVRYFIPPARILFPMIRKMRDRYLGSHSFDGKKVRSRKNNRFISKAEYQLKLWTLNRLMDMIQKPIAA